MPSRAVSTNQPKRNAWRCWKRFWHTSRLKWRRRRMRHQRSQARCEQVGSLRCCVLSQPCVSCHFNRLHVAGSLHWGCHVLKTKSQIRHKMFWNPPQNVLRSNTKWPELLHKMFSNPTHNYVKSTTKCCEIQHKCSEIRHNMFWNPSQHVLKSRTKCCEIHQNMLWNSLEQHLFNCVWMFLTLCIRKADIACTCVEFCECWFLLCRKADIACTCVKLCKVR